MPFEIERRWLPNPDDSWRKQVSDENYIDITQGYVARSDGNAVRIRLSNNKSESKFVLCIKGSATEKGVPEYEYKVSRKEAVELLRLCGQRVLHKRRWFVMVDGLKYEVDEFRSQLLAPLVLIELELKHKNTIVIPPDWVGEEVTGQMQYNNAHMVEFGRPEK